MKRFHNQIIGTILALNIVLSFLAGNISGGVGWLVAFMFLLKDAGVIQIKD
jgi:hypothetical protein